MTGSSAHPIAPAQAPLAAVIIPHFNDVDRLARCLDGLAQQDRTGLEIIVADNASTVPLTMVQEQFPWARFVTETRPGAAEARNAGIAASRAPWLFLIDCDCVPDPNWIAQARSLADGATPETVFGGRVGVFDETPPPRSGAEAFETVFAFDQANYIRKQGFSVTANMVLSREIFDTTGPFRAGFSEDLDWCHRAVAAGATLQYEPELGVTHPTRADWPALRKKWRRVTAELFQNRRAAGGGGAGWALRALAMPISALVHMPRVLRHPALSGRDRLRGVGTLWRLRCQRAIWMIRQVFGADI